jgi:hypothetical protein
MKERLENIEATGWKKLEGDNFKVIEVKINIWDDNIPDAI